MAGSIKWFVYTADDDTQFVLKADESNVEAVNGATGDYGNATEVKYAVPKNVSPRYAVYRNNAGTRNVKIPVLTPAIYSGITADVPSISDPLDETQTLTLVRIRPEQITIPFAVDTGLNDGDAT
jgi:hypothetical protein